VALKSNGDPNKRVVYSVRLEEVATAAC